MNIGPIALVTLGLGWLAADVYRMVGNVILRETRLGGIARFLDRMPSMIANPILFSLWIAVLFGWSVPLVFRFQMDVPPEGHEESLSLHLDVVK
jgi:hypothetical protein